MTSTEIRKVLLDAVHAKHKEMVDSVNRLCDYLYTGEQIDKIAQKINHKPLIPSVPNNKSIRGAIFDCIKNDFKTVPQICEETRLDKIQIRGVLGSVDLQSFFEKDYVGNQRAYRLKQTGEQNGIVQEVSSEEAV